MMFRVNIFFLIWTMFSNGSSLKNADDSLLLGRPFTMGVGDLVDVTLPTHLLSLVLIRDWKALDAEM